MKKLSRLLFLPLAIATLSGCDLFPSGGGGGTYSNENLTEANRSEIPEDFYVAEGETYYKSTDVDLWFECSGYFGANYYFHIDEENPNKRVYEGMYFYEGDYIYMLSHNMKNWHALLSDGHETGNVEVELAEGQEYHINFKNDGVYTIKFDVETTKLDVIRTADVETPKFYTIKGCDISCTALDDKFVTMSQNDTNPDEFVYRNFPMNHAKGMIFCSAVTHTSWFKVTIDEDSAFSLAQITGKRSNYVQGCVDGPVDIYINKKTYVVRMELSTPNENTFYCQTTSTTVNEAMEVDSVHPYIFRYEMVVTGYRDWWIEDFRNCHYDKFPMTFIESETLAVTDNGSAYCPVTGIVRVTADVWHRTVSAELLVE